MSDYIVDASIVIQHFVTDTYTENVNTLFDQLGNIVDLHVPEFCLLECTNVIWKRVRFHGMPQKTAELLVEDLNSLPITIIPIRGLLKLGLQVGLKHKLAVYDSLYIALGRHTNLPLITADIKQENAARLEGVTIKSIIDFKP